MTLVGASGSGKSSLLFAGLVPRLRSEQEWQIASFRPKGDPFGEVASALVPLLYPGLDKLERRKQRNQLARDLTEQSLSLSDVLAVLREEQPEGRLLLIADQFEEIYTQNLPEARQRRFLDNLIRVTQGDLRCALLMSLRADFLNQALAYGPLTEALDRFPKKILGPMTEAQLRTAIEGPAGQLGVSLEPGLAQRVLKDLGEEPGTLPLLEFALTELWERQNNSSLTHGAYDAIGGVSQALAHHADSVAAQFRGSREQLRRVFVQLVRPGEGTEDTRQMAKREQVGEANWPLVKELADKRLVVTGTHEAEKQIVETVEVVHEALIRHWQTLREWINEDRQFRTWQNRLRQGLKEWEESGRDEDALLRGARLSEAEERLHDHQDVLSAAELHYVQASIEQRDREARARWRGRLFIVSSLAVGLLIAIGLLLWANAERQHADQQRELAEAAQVQADAQRTLAFARQLAAQATLLLTSPPTEPVKGTLLAVESLRHAHTLEGYNAWSRAMGLLPRGVIRLEHRDPVHKLAFSPDGARLATAVGSGGTAAGKAQLWDVVTGQPLAVFEHAGWVVKAAFSADGRLLATASWDHTVVIADAKTGEELQRLTRDDAVSALSFRPDGKRLAIGEKDGTISVIDPSSGTTLVRMKHPSRVPMLAYSADGSRLAAASEDKTVIVWNTDSGAELVRRKHDGYLRGLAFSPSGPRLVTWNNDAGKAALLDVVTGGVLATLSSGAHDVAFTPDGSRIVARYGKEVGVWDAVTGEQIAVWTQDGYPDRAAISDSGTFVAIVHDDDQVTVLDVPLGRERCRLVHYNDVTDVAFSQDGQRLATASEDKLVRLWDASSGQEFMRLPHDGKPTRVVFSPDGRRLLTTTPSSENKYAWGEVAVWDTDNWHQVGQYAAFPIGLDDIAFSRDGKIITTVRSDKSVRLLNTKSGEELTHLTYDHDISSAMLTEDNNRLLVRKGYRGPVEAWDIRERRRVASLAEPGGVVGILLDRTRRLIATIGLHDDTFRIWDAVSGQELHRFYDGCCLSANGQRYLRGLGTKFEVRDIASNAVVSRITREGSVMGYAFSPDGNHLAVTTTRKNLPEVELWDATRERLITRLFHPFHRPPGQRPHPGDPKQLSIVGLGFSPDGNLLATAGFGDGRVYLWEASSGRLVQQLKPPVATGYTHFAFSVDSRLIAIVNKDAGDASVWDTRTGESSWGIKLDKDFRAGWPTFSPDGSLLAIGRLVPGVGGIVQVWDITEGQMLFEFPGSTEWLPNALDFSPDGALLAVGTYDAGAGVGVWDLRTGKERLRLKPGAGVKRVAFAADGDRLITHDTARIARAWDVRTGTELFRFAHTGVNEYVVYDSKRSRMATTNQAVVHVWNISKGQRIAEFRHAARVEKMALSPDGTRLVTVTDSASQADILKVDPAVPNSEASAAKLFNLRHEDYVQTVSFSSDGRVIVTGGRDRTARLWDVNTGKELAQFEHDGSVSKALLNDDNTILAVLVDKEQPGTEVHLWHVPTRSFLRVLPGKAQAMVFRPGTGVLAIASGETSVRILDSEPAKAEFYNADLGERLWDTGISTDGRLIAITRADAKGTIMRGKSAEIWDIETGMKLIDVTHDDEIWEVLFTPDGAQLATRSKDKTTRLWDVKTGRELHRFTPRDGNSSLHFNPDGRRIVISRPIWSECEAGRLVLRDSASGVAVGQPIEGFFSTIAIAFSPDARYLATSEGGYCTSKGDVLPKRMGFFGARIWDAETGRELLRLPHENNVHRVAFSPDSKLLATQVYHTGEPIRLWRVQTGEFVAELAPPQKRESFQRFAFSPDGRVLAAETGNEISVWRLSDYTSVALLSHDKRIDSFTFSPDDRLIAVRADKDGWVWNWKQARALVRLKNVRKIQLTPDSARLIAVHEDNRIRVWQLLTDDLIADACSRLERNLTQEEWRTYLGDVPYRPTCLDLPVPEK